MKDSIRMPSSKFVVVACKSCKNSQIMFNKASTKVVCTNCGEVIAEPRGGQAEIKGKLLQQV
jgi:small subunit ribosomal protein S27e